MPNEVPDYYAVLSVPPKATSEEIKRAFRRLALRYHPDRTGGDAQAAEKFNAIRIAYEVLGDAEKKTEYDSSRRLKNWLASLGRGAESKPKEKEVPPAPPAPASQPPPPPKAAKVPKPPKAEKSVKPSKAAPAPNPASARPSPPTPSSDPRSQVGSDLEATGMLPLGVAYRGGRWEVEAGGGRRIACMVPAGVRHGTRMKFRGLGAVGPDGRSRGDLAVVFRVEDKGAWLLSGNDLEAYAEVDVLEILACGDIVLADAPGGALRVKMPPGFYLGRKLIVPGRGMPAFGKYPAGDLYIKIFPVFPDLTREQANIVRRLLSQRQTPEERIEGHDERRRAYDVVEREREIEALTALVGEGIRSEEEKAALREHVAAFEAETGVAVGRWE